MRTHRNFLFLPIVGLWLLLLPGRSFADTTKNPHQHWKKPFLIIYQEGADPTLTDPKYNIPWGLVAAVWEDGWVIRAKNENLVGHAYVEGYAGKKEFKDFFRIVVSPKNLAVADTYLVPIDEPLRIISLHYGTQKHEWIFGISEESSFFKDILNRTWQLPLEQAKPAPGTDWDQKQFHL